MAQRSVETRQTSLEIEQARAAAVSRGMRTASF